MNETSTKERVWIAWETQRRSITLARKVGAELQIIDAGRKGLRRYLLAAWKTLPLLFRYRRQVVFVQNPSMVLAVLASALKTILRYTLVVDRHSNFLIGYPLPHTFRQKVFLGLSKISIRLADLTIITNRPLLERVEREGGRGFILQDPYPEIPRMNGYRRNSPLEILFVSSWSDDEPIAEMIEVCRILKDEVKVYISGRVGKEYAKVIENRPDNFIITGFIPDSEYFLMMNKVDCVLAVTKVPYLLVCGAYEGISLGKPLILGDSRELREYFTGGAVYTRGTVPDLVEKIRDLDRDLDRYREEVARFHETSRKEWERKLEHLDSLIESLAG